MININNIHSIAELMAIKTYLSDRLDEFKKYIEYIKSIIDAANKNAEEIERLKKLEKNKDITTNTYSYLVDKNGDLLIKSHRISNRNEFDDVMEDLKLNYSILKNFIEKRKKDQIEEEASQYYASELGLFLESELINPSINNVQKEIDKMNKLLIQINEKLHKSIFHSKIMYYLKIQIFDFE